MAMPAIELNLIDEILDEAEVSDLISVGEFTQKTIWHMEVPGDDVYSFVLSEIQQEALTLPQKVALKKAARCESRTKMYRAEGPIRGKLMPISVKCFGGLPILGEVFAENWEQAETKLIPKMTSTMEIVGNGVLISAVPRERYEIKENLLVSTNEVEESISAAEADGDRDTVRALRRAIRLGEQRVAAIQRGKEKKVEEGQVALF